MHLSRRSFATGALGLTLSGAWGARALAQGRPLLTTALAAIRAFAQADLAFNRLPGMTLGIVTPDGQRTVMNFGYADAEARTPITSDTLFQVGSITKGMVAAIIHQLAAEGRLRLTDRVSDLMPGLPLPPGNSVTLQQLADHTAGLASDPPLFPAGGLWTGYPAGSHWHYSNTGYEILGKVAEHVGSKPLDRLLHERIFAPLGMSRTRGAIVGADRLLYAQGYEAANQVAPYVRGVPLAPAPWVDETFGAGCVGSTAGDMLSFLISLASAAQGKGGLGLSQVAAKQFTARAVPSDMPDVGYGNGLMHVTNGGHTYLHHTGGMLSFSSSFHVDVASGVGAFASATIGAFAGYRPRLLTLFAVDAVTNALAERALPTPPPLDPPLPNARSYVGRYSGPAGAFEVTVGSPLTISAEGRSAPLLQWSNEIFRTTHPRFRQYSLMFERRGGNVVLASWGPQSFERIGAVAELPPSKPALAQLAGLYINDDPWFGAVPVVERGGKLWIGTETPMTSIGENLWRVGEESWSPERASFADFLDGSPQTFVYSGVSYSRRDV